MHHLIKRYTEWVSNAYMHGNLYDFGHYPGAISSKDTNEKVYGELYKIQQSAPLFIALDDYEECSSSFPEPHEYIREVVTVMTDGQMEFKAWTYLYNRSVSQAQHILSGRYF